MKALLPHKRRMIRALALPQGRRWFSLGVMSLTLLALGFSPANAVAVQARFDLDDRRGSPFPSDRFTVVDTTQNTGLRVNLPTPDCTARPNDCQNLDVINTLDGFNVQPRLSIPFDGPIDVSTVTSDTVFLVRLSWATHSGAGSRRVGINQVVWDVATNTLHVEADELLDQHTSYALIVTRGIRDTLGHPVEPAKAFAKFIYGLNLGQTREGREYRRALLRGLVTAALFGVLPHEVAVASVFTTQSVTAVLEKIRDQVKLGTLAPADFALGPGGTRAVYPLSALTDIVSLRQTTTAPTFISVPTPFLALSLSAPGAVGTVAFGKYLSPNYLRVDRSIPLAETRLGAPEVQDTREIFLNLVLPAGPPPASGWPVAIYGHGSGDNKEGGLFIVSSTMAAHGIATIAINAVGHGFGPLSTLSLLRGADTPITLPAGGRGIDTNANGQITSTEGSFALAPRGIIRDRDARIQTVADLMQLVRVIQIGMDVDGDGVADLDPSRIYYFGHSFGGNYGAVFLSAEPSVRAGVLMAPGGPSLEGLRLSPPNRASLGALLAARVPSLINVSGTNFDENLPLRDLPPVVNTVPGAMEIQELLDNFEWVGQSGEVVPYGAYLRRAPLEGVEPKSVIIQFARGDRALPNPTTTAILRAGALDDRATYYRFDLFLASHPTTPPAVNNPHSFSFIVPPSLPLPPEVRAAGNAVALAAQDQIAIFFASDGVEVIDPDGPGVLFETPIVPPLPEEAVFFP
jgi:hypothetical protein